jgi:hypothetical protein
MFSPLDPPDSLYLNNEGSHRIKLLGRYQWDVFDTLYLGRFAFLSFVDVFQPIRYFHLLAFLLPCVAATRTCIHPRS